MFLNILVALVVMFSLGDAGAETQKKQKEIVVSSESPPPENKIVESFDFNNVDVLTLVRQISRLTGKRFIVNESLASKKGITIIAPTSISIQEAYNVFLSVLDSNGLAVVKAGPVLKIVDKKDISSGVSLYKGDYFPQNDEYITKLIRLNNIEAKQLETDLTDRKLGLASTNIKIKALEDTNSLLVTGTGNQISDLSEMIALLDVKGYNSQLAVIHVKNADAANIKEIIFNLLFQESGGKTTTRPGALAGKSSGVITKGAEKYSSIFVDDRTNSIIVLANNAGIRKIRELVAKLDFEVEGGSDIHVYPLKNAKAEDIAKTLNAVIANKPAGKDSSPSEQVKVTEDKWTNSIVISGKPKQYETLKSVIEALDKRKGQVLFETITMEVTLNDDSSFGIASNYALSSEVPRAVGFDPAVSSTNTMMNFLANPGALSGMILGFGSKKTVSVTLNGTSLSIPSLSAFITALEKNSEANVLQRPSIIAADNEPAEIKVMDKIPVVKGTVIQQGLSQQNIDYIDVGLSLKITPRINETSDFIKLDIEQDASNLTDKAPRDLAGTTTSTDSRYIKTSIVVRDNDTVVLGGLYRDDLQSTYNKVPILGDIPIIGWFFKGKTTRSVKTNLLVFITPHIVRNYEAHSELTKKAIGSRKGFMKQNFGGDDKFTELIDAVEKKVDLQMKSEKPVSEKDYMPDNGVKMIKLD
ncbi:MAG: type II secretion system secretin GspD [Pseudomonadota bacterium]